MKVDGLEEKLEIVEKCIGDRQARGAKIAELIAGLKSARSLAPNVVEEAETHIAALKEFRKREKELTRDLEESVFEIHRRGRRETEGEKAQEKVTWR